MQIHELNNFIDSLDNAYAAVDNGNDTGKVSIPTILSGVKSEINNLDDRIDNLISGVTVDSEVIDARVGADGKTYSTLGTAIRTQIENVEDEFKQFSQNGLFVFVPDYQNGYIAQAGTTGSGGAHQLAIFEVPATTLTLKFTGGNSRRYGFANSIDLSGLTLSNYVNGNLSLDTFTIDNSDGYTYLYVYGTSNASTTPFSATVHSTQDLYALAADTVKAMTGTYVTVNSSNAASLGLSDSKNFANNRIYALSGITSAVISGFPEYGNFATLAVLSPLTNTTFNMYLYAIFTGSEVTSFYVGSRAAGDILWKKLSGGSASSVNTPEDNTLSFANEKIYIIGDSITAGSGGTGYSPNGTEIGEIEGTTYYRNEAGYCWANELKKYLEARFSCNVYNNGISGLSSRKLWVGVDDGVLIPNDATMVILDVGINDRGGNINTETYVENVINYCKTKGIKIIVSTNLPLAPYVDDVIPETIQNGGSVAQAGTTGTGGSHQTAVFEIGKGDYNLTFSGGNVRRYAFGNEINFNGYQLSDVVTGNTSVNTFSISNPNGYKYLYVYGTTNYNTTPFTATLDYDPTYTMKSWDVNQAIRKACHDLDILPVNMFAEFSKYLHDNNLTVTDVTVDGIHPNDTGYEIMFELFKLALWI